MSDANNSTSLGTKIYDRLDACASAVDKTMAHKPSVHRTILLATIVIGAIGAIVGLVAMLAVTGHLPPIPGFLDKVHCLKVAAQYLKTAAESFKALHATGAYAFMGVGGGAAAFSALALMGIEGVRWYAGVDSNSENEVLDAPWDDERLDLITTGSRKGETVVSRFVKKEAVAVIRIEMENVLTTLKLSDLSNAHITEGQTGLTPIGYIDLSNEDHPLATEGRWGKDKSYNKGGESEGNIDFSYANPRLGIGLVVDGAGHGNSLMYPVLKGCVEKFIAVLEHDLAKQNFQTIKEAQRFVEKACIQFACLLRDQDDKIIDPKHLVNQGGKKSDFTFVTEGNLPAMSLSLIVEIGNQKSLLTAQYGDPVVVIRRASGDFKYIVNTYSSHTTRVVGVGGTVYKSQTNEQYFQLPDNVRVTPLNPGDEVIGETDGAAEFLSHEEHKEVHRNNKNRAQLLTDFKDKMNAIKGEEFKGDEENYYRMRSHELDERGFSQFLPPANAPKGEEGRDYRSKYNFPDSERDGCYDDMSFFSLTVS